MTKTQITWSPEELKTWASLVDLKIDDENSMFSFSNRLAKENNWTKEFAIKAIFEYKKFVFLAKHAGHPVTPSLEIDEVWHLHLIYTRSYWGDMCKSIDFQLHHGPTKGGKPEGDKFDEWYTRTRESYQKYFGPPTQKFWPDNEVRFAPSTIKKIDTSKFFMFKKPVFSGTRSVGPKSVLFCLPLFLLFAMDGTDWLIAILLGVLVIWLLYRLFSDDDRRGGKGGRGGSSGCGSDNNSFFGGFFGGSGCGSSHSGCGSSGCGSSGCGSSCGGGCGGD